MKEAASQVEGLLDSPEASKFAAARKEESLERKKTTNRRSIQPGLPNQTEALIQVEEEKNNERIARDP